MSLCHVMYGMQQQHEGPRKHWLFLQQFSVSSDNRRVKLKPTDDYVDLDTEDFDKLLEEAVELTDHHQQHSSEDLDDHVEEQYSLADIHEHFDRYKDDDQGGDPPSEDDEYAGSQRSDSGDESGDASWLVEDGIEQADPEYVPGETEVADDDDGDGNESETEAESVDRHTHSGSTEEDHSLHLERVVTVDRHLPQAPVTPAQPLRVRQATQPEAPSRAAARVHVRPELECIPGRKRLKKQLPTDPGRQQICVLMQRSHCVPCDEVIMSHLTSFCVSPLVSFSQHMGKAVLAETCCWWTSMTAVYCKAAPISGCLHLDKFTMLYYSC